MSDNPFAKYAPVAPLTPAAEGTNHFSKYVGEPPPSGKTAPVPTFPENEPGYVYNTVIPGRIREDPKNPGKPLPGATGDWWTVPDIGRSMARTASHATQAARALVPQSSFKDGKVTFEPPIPATNPMTLEDTLNLVFTGPGGKFLGKGAAWAAEKLGAQEFMAPIAKWWKNTDPASGALGIRLPVGQIDAKPSAKAAIRKGFFLNPIDVKKSGVSGTSPPEVTAGGAGRGELDRTLNARNSEMSAAIVRQELRLGKDVVLGPEAYDNLRKQLSVVSKEFAATVPEVDFSAFRNELGRVGNRSAALEAIYPSTKAPLSVENLRRELLGYVNVPTQVVMDYMGVLRGKASANLRAEGAEHADLRALGAAQREGAQILERALDEAAKNAPKYFGAKYNEALAAQQAIEKTIKDSSAELKRTTAAWNTSRGLSLTNLARSGSDAAAVSAKAWEESAAAKVLVEQAGATLKQAQAELGVATQATNAWKARVVEAQAKGGATQTLLKRFQDARTLMAKSYDAEAATNFATGDVSGAVLAQLFRRGRPLTGGLADIATAAAAFPKVFRDPAVSGGAAPINRVDVIRTASRLHSGDWLGAAASMVAHPLRARVASPSYQKRMIGDGPQRDWIDTAIAATRALGVGGATKGAANALGINTPVPKDRRESP